MNQEFALHGHDLFGDVIKPKASGPVAERFTFSPFTVLDARSGEWQDRKRAWFSLGLETTLRKVAGKNSTTGKNSCMSKAVASSAHLQPENGEDGGGISSLFDPVICELAYRWFSPPRSQIVDPFAGGSVRGIVAGALSLNYWGCDLRDEQIDENETQADEIDTPVRPVWVCGDSMETLAQAPDADFVFSCPPYGDLEQYSDDPRDLSAMEWHTFVAAYKRIILRAVARLKPDSFACFVVGDFRDNKGFYRNFVSETIDGFEQAGARLYNEAILVTAVGSASMRVTRQFNAMRKLVKTHQNVLVFCKGDPRKATAKCNAA